MLSDDSDGDDLLLSDYLGRSTRSKARKRPATGAPEPTTTSTSKTNDDDDDDDSDDDDGLDDVPRRTNRARDKAQQKTDQLVQSVLEGMSAERERRNRMLELRRQELENDSLDKAQRDRAAQREGDEATGYMNGRPSLQDELSGLTRLYRDYSVFEDRELLKRRVRGIQDAGHVGFGGRPGLLVQSVAAVDVDDRCHEEGCQAASSGAFESYEDALGSLRQVLRRDLPEVAARLEETARTTMEMTERIGFVLEDQLFSAATLARSRAGGSEATTAPQSLVSWLHRAAMTGAGKHAYCPVLEELSSVALTLLTRIDDEAPRTMAPSLVEFHAVMKRYRPDTIAATKSISAGSASAYMNVVGLERALTYWSFDRIMRAAAGEGTVSMTMSTVSKLSLVLLDDSLERVHALALDSMLALVLRLVDSNRVGADNGLTVLAEVAGKIFHDLPGTLGPPPTTVKYVDDEQASLATSQLLAGILQLSASRDRIVDGWDAAFVSKCVRQFQLECARKALSCLDVSTLPQSDRNSRVQNSDKPPPSSPETPTNAPAPSSATPESTASLASRSNASPPGLWTDRPESVNEEAWQAFLAVVQALRNVPREKGTGVRCLAVLHSIFSLLRTALQWLEPPTANSPKADAAPAEVECHQGSATTSSPPVAGCEFGTESQAKAWLAVLERLSDELANLGKFVGSFPRSEYFRHADLLLQVVSAYIEHTARPICAKQAGLSFKPIQLKQRDIRKFFD